MSEADCTCLRALEQSRLKKPTFDETCEGEWKASVRKEVPRRIRFHSGSAIADYYVGKILTWVDEGQKVARGQKLGMITWGSQTDVLFEETPGMKVLVRPGEYAYGGETVIATY